MDASDEQLVAVISQYGKLIAFYRYKITKAQAQDTFTKKELLSMVETLKEFCTILLGQQFKIFTDQKNITSKSFHTDRILSLRIILEEYNPEL